MYLFSAHRLLNNFINARIDKIKSVCIMIWVTLVMCILVVQNMFSKKLCFTWLAVYSYSYIMFMLLILQNISILSRLVMCCHFFRSLITRAFQTVFAFLNIVSHVE